MQAPAAWYFAHDRPSGSDLSGELSDEVLRHLSRVRRDFEKDDSRLRFELRSHLSAKAARAIQRILHRLSVHLTISRWNQRLERRDIVQHLFAAGRSITEVGRALVSRIRKEEEDATQREWLHQYYDYRRAYAAHLVVESR